MTASMFGGGGSGVAGDLDMFRQALSQNWPIPPEVKKMYMDLAATVAANGQVKDKDGKVQHATVRDRMSAIKVALLAERLNLIHLQEGQKEVMHQHLHLHQSGRGEVRILEHDDWYGNHERLNPETVEPSDGHPSEPGSVQSPKLRKKVGKNGSRAHSNGKRPRRKKGLPPRTD